MLVEFIARKCHGSMAVLVHFGFFFLGVRTNGQSVHLWRNSLEGCAL